MEKGADSRERIRYIDLLVGASWGFHEGAVGFLHLRELIVPLKLLIGGGLLVLGLVYVLLLVVVVEGAGGVGVGSLLLDARVVGREGAAKFGG